MALPSAIVPFDRGRASARPTLPRLDGNPKLWHTCSFVISLHCSVDGEQPVLRPITGVDAFPGLRSCSARSGNFWMPQQAQVLLAGQKGRLLTV